VNLSDYVTSAESAEIIGVSPHRVRQLERDGVLDAVRIGGRHNMRLFLRSDVEAYAAERRAKRDATALA
jgi:excisionase family DNA binding protein